MRVKGGLEVNPENLVALVFLSRQDVCNEVVPIEEPAAPKCVQDLKDGGAVVSNLQGGDGDWLSRMRGRGVLQSFPEGRREGVE